MIEKENLSWPNWIDSGADSICSQWHVESLPSLFVLDAAGVIRFTPDDFKGPEDIDRLVEKLLAEMGNKTVQGPKSKVQSPLARI